MARNRTKVTATVAVDDKATKPLKKVRGSFTGLLETFKKFPLPALGVAAAAAVGVVAQSGRGSCGDGLVGGVRVGR